MTASNAKHQATCGQRKTMNHGNVDGKSRTIIGSLETTALRAILVFLLGLGLTGELFAQECGVDAPRIRRGRWFPRGRKYLPSARHEQ